MDSKHATQTPLSQQACFCFPAKFQCWRRLQYHQFRSIPHVWDISVVWWKSQNGQRFQRFNIPASPASFGPCTRFNKKKHVDFLCRLQNPGLRVVSSTIQAKSKPYTTTCHSSPTPFLLVTQMKRLQDSSKLDSKSPKMWHLVWLNFGPFQIQPARFLSTLCCVQATRRAWQLKYSVASTICSSHASLSVAPTMMAVLHSPRHPESRDHGKWFYYSLPRRNGKRSCDTGARAHCDTGKKAFHTTRKIHPLRDLICPCSIQNDYFLVM